MSKSALIFALDSRRLDNEVGVIAAERSPFGKWLYLMRTRCMVLLGWLLTIIDYVIRRHGSGRLRPSTDTAAYDECIQWMHYAEGSAMLPLILNFYVARLGEAGAPLFPRIEAEIANHLGYLDHKLAARAYLMGDEISGADVQR